ncbi:hypothetical protein [uncultured Nocardioides sp.]|uniref:hypothetical protein n=1 Tax=uncultured Nocardioides sp. TaxID=198441 RepID=UPI0026307EBD|nr:hypothetical protein [uncultured Nocardioides sp.]
MGSGTPSTRSSDRPARPWYASRPVAWFTVAVCGVVAASLAWLGATQPSERPGAFVVAAVMGSVALLVGAAQRPVRSRWTATDVDGRPAWRLRLGDPVGAVLVAVVLTALTVLLAGLVAADPVPGRLVLFGVPGLLVVVGAVEMWRIALVRRPHLTLTADRVELRSPGLDAVVAWRDVATVENAGGARHASVALLAVRGAPSYDARTRRLLLPTDRLPDQLAVAVRMPLVPDPAGLLRLLRELHAADEGSRAARLQGPPPG